MIRLNCFVKLNEGADKVALVENAKKLVAATLESDKGCKGYDFFASETRPDVFMFCETWESAEALNAHMHTDHFTTLVGAIEKEAAMSLEQMELKK